MRAGNRVYVHTHILVWVLQDADIHWRALDGKYHFSCQFTADLIAMNVCLHVSYSLIWDHIVSLY